jgi:hypothetical protein
MDKEYIKNINPNYNDELKWKVWKLPLTIGFVFGIISLLFFVVIGILLIIN